jgi:YVTN family beta-propeller protein
MMRKSMTMLGWAVWAAAQGLITAGEPNVTTSGGPVSAETSDRSPVDLVLSPDENWLVTANQTSHTLSLVDVATGSVIDELAVGRKPTSLAVLPGGFRVAVTCRDSGEVVVVDASAQKLRATATIPLGGHPWGIVGDAAGRRAYVALAGLGQVAVVDLATGSMLQRIPVGPWPCLRTKLAWRWDSTATVAWRSSVSRRIRCCTSNGLLD